MSYLIFGVVLGHRIFFSAAFGHSNGSQTPLVLHSRLGIRKIESFSKTSRIAFSAPGLPMFF